MSKRESNTVARVFALAKPIVESLSLSLWDVRFEKEGANWILRIVIDAPRGIGLADCEAVSRALDPVLDEEDPVEQSYLLEVSSPGIERELRRPAHFAYASGKPVSVQLIRPLDGERSFTGTLTAYDDDFITVCCESADYTFNLADCAHVKLAEQV